jgi:hypothetical protein
LQKAGLPPHLAALFQGVEHGWKYVDIWPTDPVHLYVEFLGYRAPMPRQPLQLVAALITNLQERGVPVEVHTEQPRQQIKKKRARVRLR